jgi:hypothetical protein
VAVLAGKENNMSEEIGNAKKKIKIKRQTKDFLIIQFPFAIRDEALKQIRK